MINCKNIQKQLKELKLKMQSCKKLKAEDMRLLIDLMIALDNCKCSCGDGDTNPLARILVFQYDSLTDNITNIDLLTPKYLEDNTTEYNELTLLNGINIEFNKIGRFGFVILNSSDKPYNILDVLGNNITDIVFDKLFNNLTNTMYYVSKEYITLSTIYFKFVKD